MTDTSKPIRGAIIGCGDICRTHFAAYKACGIELIAVCDLDAALAKRKAVEHGHPDIPVYTDHRELLARADLDFVTVATPVSAHAPLTIAALKAGKHVACEKPSALTLEENLAILEASRAAKKRVIFFSARNRHGMAAVAASHCKRGELGQIYRVDVQMARRRGRPGVDIIQHAQWFIDAKRAGGGVIMDMGQYYMDLVFQLTGWPEIEAVSATSFRGHAHGLPSGTTYDVEEQCSILARAKGGCTFTFDLSWIGHQKSRNEVTVRGTEGGLRLDGEDKERPFAFYRDGAHPWEWLTTTTDWRDNQASDTHLYTAFGRAIRGEAVEIGTTPEQAVAITRFTLMALKSAQLGREIKAEELPLPKAALGASGF